jgi:hypothetical protein
MMPTADRLRNELETAISEAQARYIVVARAGGREIDVGDAFLGPDCEMDETFERLVSRASERLRQLGHSELTVGTSELRLEEVPFIW